MTFNEMAQKKVGQVNLLKLWAYINFYVLYNFDAFISLPTPRKLSFNLYFL